MLTISLPRYDKLESTFYYDILDGEKPVGYFTLVFYEDAIYLRYLEIYHQYRNQKYGQRFMPILVEFCRIFGFKELFLFVDFDNEPAQKVYRKAGFYYPGYMGDFCYLMRYDYLPLIFEGEVVGDLFSAEFLQPA
jgi:ribosomal protein S18 acetylase RimI-like enzyme